MRLLRPVQFEQVYRVSRTRFRGAYQERPESPGSLTARQPPTPDTGAPSHKRMAPAETGEATEVAVRRHQLGARLDRERCKICVWNEIPFSASG